MTRGHCHPLPCLAVPAAYSDPARCPAWKLWRLLGGPSGLRRLPLRQRQSGICGWSAPVRHGEGKGPLSSRFLLLRSFGPQGSSACDVHPACATSPCSPPASRTVPVTGAGWHPPSMAVAPPTRAPGDVPHGRLRPRALPGASGEASARGMGRARRRRRGLGPRGLRTHVRPLSGVCDVAGPPHAPALGACAMFLHRHTHARPGGARRRRRVCRFRGTCPPAPRDLSSGIRSDRASAATTGAWRSGPVRGAAPSAVSDPE